jgi:predicted enzyme related to lactoylglutathione lyase
MKIKLTTVYVDEQQKALRFYTEVLGFVTKVDFSQGPYRWLTVASAEEPDGTELQLALNDNPAARAYQQAIFQQGQPAAMFFTHDLQADFERVKARGAEFTMPPTDTTGSKIARLNDTCGNLIQLTQLMRASSRRLSCRRQPPECQLLQSGAGLRDVDVALRIGGDLVAAADHARNLDGPSDFERLASDDHDVVSVSNVQESLVRVRGQCQVSREGRVGFDQLLHECSVGHEHLDAPVLPVGHVHHPILGHADGVHGAEILGSRTIREALWGDHLAVVVIHRLLAERAPHPLEHAGVGIKHGDTVIPITVGHEQFVGPRIYPHVCRPVQILCVSIARALVAMTDLPDEFAVLGKLQ